ncbi:MAG TPA: hypothetical protein VD996_04555 [Chitinophagaceae bacterium]|nr:hypothetical protein [Chitinophagaceae bacterium]
MRTKKIIILVVLLAIAGVGIYAWKEYNRKNEDLSKVKSAHTVQATALISEFTANDTLANTKYLGKVVTVEGMVKQVDRSEEGGCTVVLGDTTDMSSVRCLMDSVHAPAAISLSRSQPVKIKGSFNGFKKDDTGLLGSDVELNRCVIEKNK